MARPPKYTDDEILDICSAESEMDAICEELIARANAAGGNDNTTVVMVRVDESEDDAPPSSKNGAAVSGGAITLIEEQGGLEAFLETDEHEIP